MQLTRPVCWTLSSAFKAEEVLEYLQNTMPFAAMRSVLQYSRSSKLAISDCRSLNRDEAQQLFLSMVREDMEGKVICVELFFACPAGVLKRQLFELLQVAGRKHV